TSTSTAQPRKAARTAPAWFLRSRPRLRHYKWCRPRNPSNAAPMDFRTDKKSGPIAGATVQKRQRKESQERRCKGPIRRPDRLKVRSRERRVKVKRGLFSYCLEEH